MVSNFSSLLKMKLVLQLTTILMLLTCNQTYFAESTKDSYQQQCSSCHKQQDKNWHESDHSKAMAVADDKSILGDFTDQQVEHYGQKAIFFREKNQYKVTISYHNNSDTYLIKYTFGHYPLQQYLVETEEGRMQVLPFSWDSRETAQGGQRWFHIYSEEEIPPNDRLHWRQPLQNWNGMCADCHSDGLIRSYDEKRDTFNSSWKKINVGCTSCHDDITSDHESLEQNNGKLNSNVKNNWVRNINEKTAHWTGVKRDNSFMENCFACHSLREPLTDGFTSDKSFLDQFTPRLLISPLYHVDGQIKEEVYVYGSFLQSKMFAAGVNCLDCHDEHTMKVIATDNELCLQCHSSESYNVKQHHQHKSNSTGSKCINCHMPKVRYMGVDDRRDHSFKIPRPDVSVEFNTPNACVMCHSEQSNEWASQITENWYGKHNDLSETRHTYYLLQSGKGITLEQHLAIVADRSLDTITRATAIQLLGITTNQIASIELKPYLDDKDHLIRLAAANSARLIPVKQRTKIVAPLLSDTLKSIRIAAARALIDVVLECQYETEFKQALIELQTANKISSWRGEGRVNSASAKFAMKNFDAAEQALVEGIEIDPFFEASYINLADYYRSKSRPDDVISVLFKGMKNIPSSAVLKYSYGLYLVRTKENKKAVSFFEQAMLLSPNNQQYIYIYILSLDSVQQTNIAIVKLKIYILKHPKSTQLRELGLHLAHKTKNQELYDWFLKQR